MNEPQNIQIHDRLARKYEAGFITDIESDSLPPGLGEDIILDLRTAVFDHVQKMPIAFFMRTRTGALVSRLNNDVIGAQRQRKHYERLFGSNPTAAQ